MGKYRQIGVTALRNDEGLASKQFPMYIKLDEAHIPQILETLFWDMTEDELIELLEKVAGEEVEENDK